MIAINAKSLSFENRRRSSVRYLVVNPYRDKYLFSANLSAPRQNALDLQIRPDSRSGKLLSVKRAFRVS